MRPSPGHQVQHPEEQDMYEKRNATKRLYDPETDNAENATCLASLVEEDEGGHGDSDERERRGKALAVVRVDGSGRLSGLRGGRGAGGAAGDGSGEGWRESSAARPVERRVMPGANLLVLLAAPDLVLVRLELSRLVLLELLVLVVLETVLLERLTVDSAEVMEGRTPVPLYSHWGL